MKRLALKFGGTSVGTIEKIKEVANIIKKRHSEGNEIIVIVSAMSGVTNDLHKKSNLISKDFDSKELDVLLSSGEQISCSLLSGAKGIGKATFAYHLVNYLLSHEEKNNYSLEQQKINPENHTYKLLKSNIHPNFYLLNSIEDGGEIKIDQVRALLKFLRNTTYNKNIKVVSTSDRFNMYTVSPNLLVKK